MCPQALISAGAQEGHVWRLTLVVVEMEEGRARWMFEALHLPRNDWAGAAHSTSRALRRSHAIDGYPATNKRCNARRAWRRESTYCIRLHTVLCRTNVQMLWRCCLQPMQTHETHTLTDDVCAAPKSRQGTRHQRVRTKPLRRPCCAP